MSKKVPISSSEVAQFRADTPGTVDFLHFNSAGSALPPTSVVEIVTTYLHREALRGGYRYEAENKVQLDEFYQQAASLLNAGSDEVAFTGSATAAWRTVFNGLSFAPGDEILTSVPEYGSNFLAFLQAQEEFGVTVKTIPDAASGQIDLEKLAAALSPKTKLVAITHVPSNSGLVQPAAEIGKLTQAHGALYLLDACQSIGQMPLDVAEIGCDMLTATGRKFLRGPRGTGLLYIRKAVWDRVRPTSLDIFSGHRDTDGGIGLREDARRYETFENNRALILGISEAIRYAQEIGLGRIRDMVQPLAAHLRTQLQQLPGITVLDRAPELSGIVTFIAAQKPAGEIAASLERQNVNLSVAGEGAGYLYADQLPQKNVLRASVHYYNTEEEIATFCQLLELALK